MTIGEKIREIRKSRGMTQKELGEKMGGISAAAVNQFEGKKYPYEFRLKTIEKISKALQVDTSELMPSYSILPDIMFLCNGMKEECSKHVNCYKNGGECRHTSDLNYALNFKVYLHNNTCIFWEGREPDAKSEAVNPGGPQGG